MAKLCWQMSRTKSALCNHMSVYCTELRHTTLKMSVTEAALSHTRIQAKERKNLVLRRTPPNIQELPLLIQLCILRTVHSGTCIMFLLLRKPRGLSPFAHALGMQGSLKRKKYAHRYQSFAVRACVTYASATFFATFKAGKQQRRTWSSPSAHTGNQVQPPAMQQAHSSGSVKIVLNNLAACSSTRRRWSVACLLPTRSLCVA